VSLKTTYVSVEDAVLSNYVRESGNQQGEIKINALYPRTSDLYFQPVE